jgi:hypothetical protein
MPKKWHKEIQDYFDTLFSRIRRFLEKEPHYKNYVPEMFKFPYLVLSFRCPNGYVVAAYPSGFADNYIHVDQNKGVAEILRSLPNKILGTSNNVGMITDEWDGSGRYEMILDRVETDRGPLQTTGWKFLHVATRDQHWRLKEAREFAEELISVFKARSLLYDAKEGGHFIQNYDRVVMRHEITNRLHNILQQYKSIISEKSFAERVIHRYLRDHPILLYPTKKRLLYEYPLTDQGKLVHKVDFIVEFTTGRYILVELENPKHEIFTKRGDYSSMVGHAEKQVEDWIHFVRKNHEMLENDLPGIIAPEGIVIIGRSQAFTPHQIEKIRIRNEKHAIKLITYDDLAEEAENHIAHILDT